MEFGVTVLEGWGADSPAGGRVRAGGAARLPASPHGKK